MTEVKASTVAPTPVSETPPPSELNYAPPLAKSIPFSQIPLVDFGAFRNGTDEEKRHVADEIGRSLNEVGFFYLTNHGLPAEVLNGVFQAARNFFELPDEVKDRVSSSNTSNHRGYFPIGGENVDPLHTRDIKEGFDIGFEGTSAVENREKTGLRGANQWPEDLPGFQSALEQYYEHSVALGRDLCRAFALSLSLDESEFDQDIAHSESRMRLLSYPGQPGGATSERAFGAGAHADCGCLTILAQDDVGGLAVRNADGEWIAADPIEGALVCNVGDMMEQWSGGRFSSTIHRVINSSDRTRNSVALFFNPSFDVMVEGFKSLLGDKAAEPGRATAGEYLKCCYDEIRSACQLP